MSKGSKIGIGLGVVVLAVILFAGNSSLNKGSLKFLSSQPTYDVESTPAKSGKFSKFSDKKAPAPAPAKKPAAPAPAPTPAPSTSSDLVAFLGFPAAPYQAGALLEFRGTIANVGTVHHAGIPNTGLRWKVTQGSRVVEERAGYNAIDLAPGANTLRTFLYRFPNLGTYNVEVCVDYENRVSETNETNNCMASDITLSSWY
ncbi:hypothetical protein COV82_05560 [Candidatus Peregrinibacteria bacterium CG11_big_fil_rev_8_21_14_0_20_46_8]|nr:MAG: hypothetical protein COV82_05560 [Candidatus Peregrinibacteria bacterium CG11_big_fil_rev_8_21_14_0_20_46_8]